MGFEIRLSKFETLTSINSVKVSLTKKNNNNNSEKIIKI